MQIYQNVALADHSTMRVGGLAKYAVDVTNRNEIIEAVNWAAANNIPTIMIGSGSNIVWRDEGFNGLLIVNKIMGYELFDEDGENYYLTVGAGEPWDSVVERAVSAGVSGIEALSLIPGTTGATPVQNVGAYGQEIAQTLVSIEAYDSQLKQLVTIPNTDCNFGYRTSRFKTNDRGHFFISGITLHLTKTSLQPPFYSTLQQYLDQHKINTFSPQIIRDAVIEIRKGRLPDPAIVANNGSFFANPIIDNSQLSQLLADYPDIKYWPMDDSHSKLSAAWLLEQTGFKNAHDKETGMATWSFQPLVLVNESATSTANVLSFKQKIVDAVQSKFNVTLEQEPELLP